MKLNAHGHSFTWKVSGGERQLSLCLRYFSERSGIECHANDQDVVLARMQLIPPTGDRHELIIRSRDVFPGNDCSGIHNARSPHFGNLNVSLGEDGLYELIVTGLASNSRSALPHAHAIAYPVLSAIWAGQRFVHKLELDQTLPLPVPVPVSFYIPIYAEHAPKERSLRGLGEESSEATPLLFLERQDSIEGIPGQFATELNIGSDGSFKVTQYLDLGIRPITRGQLTPQKVADLTKLLELAKPIPVPGSQPNSGIYYLFFDDRQVWWNSRATLPSEFVAILDWIRTNIWDLASKRPAREP